jgi:hypothetical protein
MSEWPKLFCTLHFEFRSLTFDDYLIIGAWNLVILGYGRCS